MYKLALLLLVAVLAVASAQLLVNPYTTTYGLRTGYSPYVNAYSAPVVRAGYGAYPYAYGAALRYY